MTEYEDNDGFNGDVGVPLSIVGVLCWATIPFVIGRLFDSNVSIPAGTVARPAVMILMLVWAMYRPSESRLKTALLRAIDLTLSLAVVGCCVRFIIALLAANFAIKDLHPVAWLALAAGVGLLIPKYAIRRWIQFAVRG
ncbi:hypothetical protein [Polymorphobacter megasporae]|uniref:hypothetical protein n=1 Tax=Glacieibacterium megasporae TaxID=2835787 RepID=UPI001C1E53F6|nr:hypothetical protein [Polymorphobacter megasporae]UAJ10507.1 hypothetical protein KTC28_01710 [Polymorphobacter megasporae]